MDDDKPTVEETPDRKPAAPVLPKEIGGAKGPEPTRYGGLGIQRQVHGFLSGSFLQKRTKKLLQTSADSPASATALEKVFASFFKKKPFLRFV